MRGQRRHRRFVRPRRAGRPGRHRQGYEGSNRADVADVADVNDYLGFDPATGVLTLDPANDTATDSKGRILVHKTWDGHSANWSDPVVDLAGLTQDMGGGKKELGGGRPGMTNVRRTADSGQRTADSKWMLPFEYWGGGADTRHVIADNPLDFYRSSATGTDVASLPLDAGSRPLARGGGPVIIGLPGCRLVYDATATATGTGSVRGDVPDVRLLEACVVPMTSARRCAGIAARLGNAASAATTAARACSTVAAAAWPTI